MFTVLRNIYLQNKYAVTIFGINFLLTLKRI